MDTPKIAASASINPRLIVTRMVNLVVQGFDELTLHSDVSSNTSGIKIAVSEDNAQIIGVGLTKPDLLNANKTISDKGAKLLKGKLVELMLSSESSIDLEFNLPSSPVKDLKGMIEAEILYRSPFGDGQSYSIWEAEETETGAWDIRAAVTLRSTLTPVLEALKFAGAKVTSVRRAPEENMPGYLARPLWAVTAPQRSFDPLISLIPKTMLAPVAAGVLLVISTFLVHVQTGLALSRLENQASGSRAELAVAARAAQSQREIYLLEKGSLQRLMLPGMLTDALPDDVWLQQIDIDSQVMTVSGFGPSGADVTRILSGFSGLVEVGFASPLTRDNTQNIERFRIGAELRAEEFTVAK